VSKLTILGPKDRLRLANARASVPWRPETREDPRPPGAGSAAAAQGPSARGGAKLRHLSRAGRHEHLAPGCAASGSRGGAAPHVCLMPVDSGAILMSRPSEPQPNLWGRPNHDKTTAQPPVPSHPGWHRPPTRTSFESLGCSRGRLNSIGANLHSRQLPHQHRQHSAEIDHRLDAASEKSLCVASAKSLRNQTPWELTLRD
jgi:hypothetical protein